MRDFRWELTRLSDLKYDPETAWRHDLDYRRGCDQTASRIMDHVARLADKKEIVRALHAWTDVLGEMRYDGQQHLLLLDEAAQRVTKRLPKGRRPAKRGTA